ncbi:MAG: Fe-S cluster assembly scaffold protein NifU [candidate division WOR-3 bacterium]
MYSEKVMDHFRNPRNMGRMEDADGIGKVGNPVCGDVMWIYIKVKDNRIVDVSFETFGCAAAIATSSMATELVKDKTIEEALEITNKAVATALDGLPPIKLHCSLLAEEGIKAAIEDYLKKKGKPAEEEKKPGSKKGQGKS